MALAAHDAGWSAVVWWRVVGALAVSLALQIGVNYANDYSDGIRGTDDVRVGPMRLVASGRASAVAVRTAALMALGIAAVVGLLLALATSWWLLLVGAAAIIAAWGYTGGPRPYGYAGLGEVFVFVFFGLVATAGTTYVAVEAVSWRAWVAGCGVGALACALLVVNNLRDIPTDSAVGKRTLAVRLGDRATRWFFVALVIVALASVIALGIGSGLIALLSVVAAVPPVRQVLSGAAGRDLITVLGATGRLQLVFGLLLTIGVALAA
jgi:1,4-dihydroxy-2-naphthoate octaprenyltransferase